MDFLFGAFLIDEIFARPAFEENEDDEQDLDEPDEDEDKQPPPFF